MIGQWVMNRGATARCICCRGRLYRRYPWRCETVRLSPRKLRTTFHFRKRLAVAP